MPSRLAYDEAIMLARARLRMRDPELREGEVEKAAQQTRVGAKLQPWGIEGGFAVVYKYRTQSGRLRALRCFRAAVQPDTQTRYTQLGPYFKQHLADITAEFRYFDPGILVKEPPDPPKEYPIIDMEWVEGATLLSKVDELCRARNQAGLGALADRWLEVMRRLRQAQVAHGDLAAENVMVRPDGRLVLIDYDVVYIPAFAGMQVLVVGQEDYQHRQSDQRQYNEWMDEFPALVIYTALRVLQAQPQLWDKHTSRNDKDKPVDSNLLFRHSDFVLPARSALFLELDQISDPTAKAAILALKKACVQPLDQVRFQITSPLEEFERAIIADDDDQILQLWKPPLDQDPAAQRHLPRVELARKRIAAREQLRNALKTGNIQQIAVCYAALLPGTRGLTAEEQKQAELATRFHAARRANNEEQVLAVWEDMQKVPQPGAFRFTPQEQALITQARGRKTALAAFRDALKHKHIQQIVDSYTPPVQQHKSVTPEERKCWELARAFLDAYRADDDDDAILAAHSEIENFQYRDRFEFTPAEKARIELARQRRDALVKARLALKNHWIAQIAQAAVPILDGSRKLTADERKQLDLARRFMDACKAGNDEAIVALREEIRRSPYENFFRFSDADGQRITLAQQQIQVLEGFRHVLRTGTARQVANFAAAHLQGSTSLKPEERQCLEAAQKFVAAYDKPDEEALVAASDAVRAHFHRPGGFFTAEEVQRIELARRRKEALDTFRRVAFVQKSTKALELLNAYAAPVLDQVTALTPKERQLIQDARAFQTMYQAVLKAIQSNDDQRIVAEYKPALVKHFTDFTQAERERIVAAQRYEQHRVAEAEARQALAQAYTQQKYRDVLLIAEKLQGMTKKPLKDVQIALAKQRLIATQDPQQLKAQIQGNDLIATWKWPTDDLIQHVAVVWSLDHWPKHPEKKDRDDFIALIERNDYKQQGKCQVSVGHVARVYVQVYAALKNVQGQQEPVWYYSEGRDMTARAEVRIPCKVVYRLTRRPGSPTNELHIETDNGAPLPELVVVRKAGDVPASDGDGERVARIGSNGSSKFREVLPLHVWNWPPKSVIRVFAVHASDTAWLTLVPLPDVWLEVN